MEAVGVVFVLVALGLLVLQILMIAKFFQIAADISAIKNWLMGQGSAKEIIVNVPQNPEPHEQTLPETTPSNETEPWYRQEGETIIFNDGLSGKLQKRFGEWWIYTDRGNQSFTDKEMAIRRLHKDLSEQ
ncbi:hypothetical protein [uncultured Rikenella sp.]|uniref:hypothetical protein n=1 Tax=uncultured Rikenella sp. TaxID=368003 RepID=UPI00272B6E92|nr:hypothetical protein [uncultured Rikenella sp.]